MKSEYTVTHKSVIDLQASAYILLTATPMINRPLDLAGLLTLFWRPEWTDPASSDLNQGHYEAAKADICGKMLSVDDIDRYRWLLTPELFKLWAMPDRELGYFPASEANRFIPPILAFIQLKRTSATRIDDVSGKGSYRIGAEIPPVHWLTLEMQMLPRELFSYAEVHAICTGNLGLGYDDTLETGLRNMTFHRKLCLAVLSMDLEKVSTNNDGPALIEKFYHKNKDHGATYYFNATKPDPTLPLYREKGR